MTNTNQQPDGIEERELTEKEKLSEAWCDGFNTRELEIQAETATLTDENNRLREMLRIAESGLLYATPVLQFVSTLRTRFSDEDQRQICMAYDQVRRVNKGLLELKAKAILDTAERATDDSAILPDDKARYS